MCLHTLMLLLQCQNPKATNERIKEGGSIRAIVLNVIAKCKEILDKDAINVILKKTQCWPRLRN